MLAQFHRVWPLAGLALAPGMRSSSLVFRSTRPQTHLQPLFAARVMIMLTSMISKWARALRYVARCKVLTAIICREVGAVGNQTGASGYRNATAM